VLRSGIVNTIRELAVQGKPIRRIADELGLARNTVRKYLRGGLEARSRPKRPSKLDPFKEQLQRWVCEDHLTNCETLVGRLQAAGYVGKTTLVKDFVRPLRPRASGRQPVIRYETKPGEQLQFDWGEFVYEQAGATRKLFGFTAILSYSRLRYVVFAKRCDAPSLIRCLAQALGYFGGVPRSVLTDRMKTVLLEMESGAPHWHPRFQELVSALGIMPRVCKPYTPQTKGKVERSIGLVKHDFWPGVHFCDLDDLNQQTLNWCEQINQRVHRTTHHRPVDQLSTEGLRPLPSGWAWERFLAEDRRVSWDGYVSYDGVLYGLPSPPSLPSRPGTPAVAGACVQVSDWQGEVRVWQQGTLVLATTKRTRSGTCVPHPDQFRSVVPAAAARRAQVPLGHQISAPAVAQRPLSEYDQLCGVGGFSEVGSAERWGEWTPPPQEQPQEREEVAG
jgi:transposase